MKITQVHLKTNVLINYISFAFFMKHYLGRNLLANLKEQTTMVLKVILCTPQQALYLSAFGLDTKTRGECCFWVPLSQCSEDFISSS